MSTAYPCCAKLNNTSRKWLFLCGCLPIRLLLASITLVADPLFSILLFYFAVRFVHNWFRSQGFCILKQCCGEVKTHGVFGGKIYWADARIVHGLMYFFAGLASALSAINADLKIIGGCLLYIDVVFGIQVWCTRPQCAEDVPRK
jgi:hypothetical protein